MRTPPLREFGVVATMIAMALLRETAAADTVTYTFGSAGQETTAETSPAYSPVSIGNLSGTPVTDPLGTVGIEISSAATAPPSAPFLRLDPQGNSTSAAIAITNNKYFTFTITPNAGTLLSSALDFDVTRGGTGTPRGYLVRSSADNFTADLSTADLQTVRPAFTHVNIPLGAPVFQNLSSLTFRFYSYAPAAGNSVDYDNIVFTAVPEPGSGILLAGGLVSLLAARGCRRR